ncbi:MAG: hypothetical protein JRE64_14065 [Deltaproteobacteria bacterium]|nr:hypothetical protein [Deltaproteobacteria bacterium]
MCEWKEMLTIKNGKLVIDNYTEFDEQLKEEEKLKLLIAENLGTVKVDG